MPDPTTVRSRIDFAPQIGQLREEVLGGTRGLLGEVQQDIQTLRGIDNPFLVNRFRQARIAPFVEERERARRDATRRSVAGPLTQLATNPADREIARQEALAENQAAVFEQSVRDEVRQSQAFVRQLLQDVSGQGEQLLRQELQTLGLGTDDVNLVINSMTPQFGQRQVSETEPNIFASLFPGGLI